MINIYNFTLIVARVQELRELIILINFSMRLIINGVTNLNVIKTVIYVCNSCALYAGRG